MIRKGDIVVDEAHCDRIGTIQDIVGTRLWLRRLDGGREWDVSLECCRKATEAEILGARNAARNRMTSNRPH